MNYLKAGLRVKFNMTNPYEIKPEFKLLNEQGDKIVKARLEGKVKVNYDTYVTRFKFEESDNKCLGLQIGQFVWLNMNEDKRPYVPISPIDQSGGVQFLIRDLTKHNSGSFTQKILNLKTNQTIDITGPGTQYLYKGYGKMIHGNFSPVYATSGASAIQPAQNTYKNIGIITHASGITTTFSLIQSILMNYDNRTGVSLLWLGDTIEDFIFLRELTSFVEQGKLNLNLMLTKYQKGWLGPYGKVTSSHIQDFLPYPKDDTMIMMSALEGQNSQIKELVKQMHYPHFLYV